MFDFLKKKLSKLAENFSKKIEKKEAEQEKEVQKIEEAVEKIETKLIKESPEKALEEIKETVETKLPEVSMKVEEAIREVKSEIESERPEEIKMEPKVEELESTGKPIAYEAKRKMEKVIESRPEVKLKEPEEKKSWIKKISEKIVKKIVEKRLDEDDIRPLLEELETDLLESDVALEVVDKIKNDLRSSLVNKEIGRGKEKDYIKNSIKQSLNDILSLPSISLRDKAKSKKPFVILFLGFNGNGKTTTVAKVAKWITDNGYSCVISASDCFRAAAIDQIEEHAKKLGVKLIKHQYGADPAAVAFDAISHAKANGIDFVLIDTAGRTHTNVNLMKEMEKIVRVSKPDLKVLVLDSLIGNDAVSQARTFNDTIGIDSVIFTKVDINPKGGSILSLSYILKKPVLFLSIGQDYSDLKEFDRDWFVGKLTGNS